MPYESPSKKQLEEALAKGGSLFPPELRTQLEAAIASIDHTNPQDILQLLPEPVLGFYRHTVVRALEVAALMRHAVESRCYIETILLAHGVIQFAPRGLYVLAWQRASLPKSLSEDQLEPYVRPGRGPGDVFPLIRSLEAQGLIFDVHANHLRQTNDLRNRAAHGIICGEIGYEELEASALKAQQTATGALHRLQAWFNNPQPLRQVPL